MSDRIQKELEEALGDIQLSLRHSKLKEAAQQVVDAWYAGETVWHARCYDVMEELRLALEHPKKKPDSQPPIEEMLWVIDCGECDIDFPCYNGKSDCIRHT